MFNEAKRIYDKLEDEISKVIFTARLNYSATMDMSFITNIPVKYRNLNADIEFYGEKLRTLSSANKKVVIFGAGANGKNIAKGFSFIDFFAFIDNYHNEEIEPLTGLFIYSLENYIGKYGIDNTIFIISVSNRDITEKIREQLQSEGISNENILISIPDYRNNSSQYFDFFVPHQNESFVDAGCWDGGTAYRFAGWCGQLGYNKIFSFEPDKKSYEICKVTLQGLRNCSIYPYGLSDKTKSVSFIANGNEDARIIRLGENILKNDKIETIDCVALDELLSGEEITFIKMDIEGAEYDAIVGATKIITEQKPRLAVSVYHNAKHFIEIPRLLLELRPDYRIWMRQYSLLSNETILYAE
ncbi:FkbM family methyltransferase [Clostridium sp. KNHs205]|jgi:FkbM family methyltransferase|uniref:FkbM family methyltransferase n=1 Tax=Clostridium sp. KNHs205 TaxID=1449050 RepID=UPI00068CC31F|nr:FkbM family methyltransferase [Clostridium sp. KNHs205]